MHDGLRADQVLAITFTEKAAGELRARVRARLLELGHREAAREAEAAWITTFHGFCARILRAHAVAAGLDPGFGVLDPADGRAAQREAFEAALADFLAAPRADALDLAAGYTVDRLQRMVVAAHDELRSRGQTRPTLPPGRPADLDAARAELDRACSAFAAELAGAGAGAAVDAAREALTVCRGALEAGAAVHPKDAKVGRTANALKTPAADAYRAACEAHAAALADRLAVPALALVDELLGRYADAYAAAKRARGGVDFDDLELLARDLLAREPGIAAGYRERFERVMVDEFQDTNALQLELLELRGARQRLHGRRRAAVDLRLPPCRRGGLPRTPRARSRQRAGPRRWPPTSARARRSCARSTAPSGRCTSTGSTCAPGATTPRRPSRVVELLVTDADALERRRARRAAASGCRRPARSSRPRRGSWPSASPRSCASEGVAPATSSCCCARRPTWASTSARSSWQGLSTLAAGGRGWWGRQQILRPVRLPRRAGQPARRGGAARAARLAAGRRCRSDAPRAAGARGRARGA